MDFFRFLKRKSKLFHLKHLVKKRKKAKTNLHHLFIVAKSVARKFRGFTLIELLVVIAVLSILAVIIIVAINPQNKFTESRDSTRKAAVSMLGSASQAYSLVDIVTGIMYPEAKSNWIESLATESEIKTAPPLVPTNDNYYCQEDSLNGWYRQNGYCYKTNSYRSQATIAVRLESQAELGKCPPGTKYTYFVWSSELGKAGTFCTQDGGAIGDEPGITIFPGLTLTPTLTPTPGGPGDPTSTPTVTPGGTPSCSSYGNCSNCIAGAPYTCGWNGVSNSCEDKPNQITCPAGYTQWYWGSCSVNVCAAPTSTPTVTPGGPTLTPTVTPGGTPSCSSYGNCSTCIVGAPYTCGWNGTSNSCESKPNQITCPAGYTQWYWGSCSVNVCAAPTLTPTITPTVTPACTADGAICGSNGDCCNNHCYVDGDGDTYSPVSGGTKTCHYSPVGTGYDYNDNNSQIYPNTNCNGSCSVNTLAGTCIARSAGKNARGDGQNYSSISACVRCDGVSLSSYAISGFSDTASPGTQCYGNCSGWCSEGLCQSIATPNGTCSVATSSRVTSGGDGYCTGIFSVPACQPSICGAGNNTVTFTYKGASVTYGTVSSYYDNKCWMDRNLGASQVATTYNDSSSYGDLFQRGRAADGHQNRTSGTTTVVATGITPGHANFIYGSDVWTTASTSTLWQAASGYLNNPCPSGWHVPTWPEWRNQVSTWALQNSAGAWYSILRLTVAGFRDWQNGAVSAGRWGSYWSSDLTTGGGYDDTKAMILFNESSYLEWTNNFSEGASVRCIKN